MFSAQDMKSSFPDNGRKRTGSHASALLLALLVFQMVPSVALARGVEVRSVSPAVVIAEPGEIVTLSFRVTNRTSVEQQLEEAVALPEGWRAVMPLFDFLLGPDREATRIVVIQAGRHAGSGDYDIRYTVTDVKDPAVSDGASVRLSLSPVYDISLDIYGLAPEQVIAGETFSFKARVANPGNSPLNVRLAAEIPGGGAVSAEPSAFTLSPGDNRLVDVTGYTNPGVHRLERRSVRIDAATDRVVDGRPVAARLSVPLEVVPLVAGVDIYRRFPVELSAHLGGDEDDHGVQFTLRGDGYLDEAREHRLAFSMRAPDRKEKAVLAHREEYWGRYNTTAFSVLAGDQSYGLSELTSQGRYGRGAGADYHDPGMPAGGGLYHVVDRWGLQKRKDTGAYFSYRPLSWADFRLNLLRLGYDAWGSYPVTSDDLASLQGNFTLRENDRLRAEFGYSSGDRYNMEMSRGSRTGKATDTAYRADYYGTFFKDLRLNLTSRRSGPQFAGRYSDTLEHRAGLDFPMFQRLRFNFTYQRYERNLDADPLRGSAPRENLYRGGFNLRLPRQWHVGLTHALYDRSDALPARGLDRQEHQNTISLGRSAGAFSYRVQARHNRARKVRQGPDYSYWAYDGSLTYRHNRTLYLTVTGGYSEDDRKNVDSRLLQQGKYIGGSARWQPTADFSIHANYRRNDTDYPDEPLRERFQTDHYGAGLSRRLPNRHRIQVDARRSSGTARESYTTYYATYTIPFNVPIGRKQSVGSLTGRVFRADAPGNPGVAGAVVYVDGTAARTDTTGRFQFMTLPPGDYELRLDDRSIDLGMVQAGIKRARVTVTGGQTVEKDISLTDSGSVEGLINIADPPGNGNGNGLVINGNGEENGYVAGGPNNNNNNKNNRNNNANGNILVEMARDGETRRTISNKDGRFLFEQLVPGDWTLKVYGHNLPEHHYLENGTLELLVEAGKRQEVTVRVLPRMREIRFIDEGRISAED